MQKENLHTHYNYYLKPNNASSFPQSQGKKLFQIRYCGSFANLQKYKKGIINKGVSVLFIQNTNKKQVDE